MTTRGCLRQKTAPLLAALAIGGTLALSGAPARATCITDDTDTEVCVESPRRLISLYGAFTEILGEFGATDRLVARTKNDVTPPAVADLPSVGTGLRPDVEYLLALRPDLVISRASRASSETLGALRERGLTVAAFDPRGLEDLHNTVRRMGQLTGHSNAAASLSTRIRNHLAEVRRRTVAIPADRKPRVVFEVRADPLTVAGQGGLVSDIIAAAGGVNAVASPKKLLRFDVEALLQLSPDAYVVQEGPMNRNPTPPAERPHIGVLPCVREGRVLLVDETLFSRPGPRVAEAAEQLSRFLFPERWRTP